MKWWIVLALTVAACKTTNPGPVVAPPVTYCDHPCDVENGLANPRQISCQMAAKIEEVGGCKVK